MSVANTSTDYVLRAAVCRAVGADDAVPLGTAPTIYHHATKYRDKNCVNTSRK